MEVDLPDFVEQCRHLIKQALEKHAGESANGGFARWAHIVLHCFRPEEGHSYREAPNRLRYITEARDALDLDWDEPPDYSMIYKSFDQLKTWVWRVLLRVSTRQHPRSGHAAFDNTSFDRRRALSCFRQRLENTVQTLKVTTLTDAESLTVLGVYVTARWKHDTRTGPQVVRRNADGLQSVTADNSFQDWHTEYEIAAHDVEYLAHYRESSSEAALNNTFNRANGYSQHWMAETSYSTAGHLLGDVV